MLLFNTYLLFLVLALSAWLFTIAVELRSAAASPDADERAVAD